MDIHTDDIELGSSGETIDTPEELKERQRIKDIMTARREARQAFKEETKAHIMRLESKADPSSRTITPAEADELAARNVFRHVSAYIEELVYHFQTTDPGKHYWKDATLGEFTPNSLNITPDHDGPVPPSYGHNPEPIVVEGIAQYLALGETVVQEVKLRTGEFGQRETHRVETAMPTSISRSAFRATNLFVEELLGLELDRDKTTVYNISLGTSDDPQTETEVAAVRRNDD